MMTTFLTELAPARRIGEKRAITSVCSAHRTVIRAALRQGKRLGQPVLIEATCNQVNQDGGYTGMTPADFRAFVEKIAAAEGFPADRLILGGDHLGPNPWRKLPAEEALAKAEAMMAGYVAAGFSKIHLDASMGCASEPEALDDETTAHRAARLAAVAERVARDAGVPPPLYIIGTEVPTPGGAVHALDHLTPTCAAAARETIATHRRIFAQEGLQAAFDRAIGIVVQPGVEFGHENVVWYAPERARDLVAVLDQESQFIFEAHSTDYQPPDRLAKLVSDGFAILKVGPGLTFALRQALYGLDCIAAELDPSYGGRALAMAMDSLMLTEPEFWQSYYPGSAAEQHVLLHYSYSDRIRYYWPHDKAERAVGKLMETLASRPIPETLIAQFLPLAEDVVRSGALPPTASALIDYGIERVLNDYAQACR
ncbi:D-tagatose-bisphosphate aldolase, class II, non-catalytic subunit [Mesorhizobium sp.]|uniref:D-tagatose-bisphosphate aldolase, class II, non-catalytic subunit n=1 Tax=Mesorhizobium sp. TaxID=1871066 RepID=UPI0011FF966A|nr:D-tagatose-bisphosphate aldolase, class II, non-catalytic subunit [Mesorhizobium sp.]TIP08277.1 MAG: D-tagatose-bisphosphate aldolase, class II, non-catalytic subunit [Mesorhizobium sp.]